MNIILPRPAGVRLHGRLSSNVRPHRNMRRQPSSRPEEDEVAARVGGTAAGLLAGLVAGAVAAALFVVAGAEVAAGWAFFLCIATGTVAGYLSAAAGLSLAEGVVHFISGAAHGVAKQMPSSSDRAPWWLQWLLFAGVLLGLAVLVAARW
jgi:hypothetical protein